MDLEVVAVAVAALRVVAEQQVGVLLVQQRGELPGGFGRVSAREPHAPWRVGVEFAAAAAVGVAEVLGSRGTQDRGALAELVQPAVRCSHGAVAGDHDHDPVTVGGQLGQRPAGQQHLVIGVGVKRENRRHET